MAASFALALFLLLYPWFAWRPVPTHNPDALRWILGQSLALLLLLLLAWQRPPAPRPLPAGDDGRARRDGPGRPSLPARLALAALVAFPAWAALSLTWSADPSATAMELFTLLPWALLAGLSALLAREPRRLRLLTGALMASGLLLAAGALAGPRLSGWIPGAPEIGRGAMGRLLFPFYHSSTLGGVLLAPLVLLVIAGGLQLRRHPARALGLLAGGALAGAALVGSGTRSSLVGAAAALLAFPLLLAWNRAGDTRRRRLRQAAVVAALLLLLGAAVFTRAAFRDEGLRRRVYTSSWGTRPVFGRAALRAALARPLTGWGAGTTGHVLHRFQEPEDWLQAQRGGLVINVHNEPLQVAADLGAAGLLLWALLHGGAVLAAAGRRGTGSAVRVALAAALVGMIVDAGASPSLRYAEFPWWYAVVLGLALGAGLAEAGRTLPSPGAASSSRSGAEPEGPGPRRRPLALSTSAAAALWAGLVLIPGARAEIRLAQAARERDASPRTSLETARKVLPDARLRMTWFRAMELRAHLARRLGRVPEARAAYGAILLHLPSAQEHRASLSAFLYRAGRAPAALRLALEGLRLNPHDEWQDGRLGHILRGTTLRQLRDWTRSGLVPAADPAERAVLELRLARQAGNRPQARILLEGLLDRTGDLSGPGLPRLVLARWQQEDGDAARALRTVAPLLARTPADPRALALAARIHFARAGIRSLADAAVRAEGRTPAGDALVEARRLGSRALALSYANPDALETGLMALLSEGAFRRARGRAELAVKHRPGSPEVWRLAAEAHALTGRPAAAHGILATALGRFPPDAELTALAKALLALPWGADADALRARLEARHAGAASTSE